jgi:predicted PurR-regulated permease PerM
MANKKVDEAAEYVSDKPPQELLTTAKENATIVMLDPSTPSVRSIVRIVLITLLILFVAGFVQRIFFSLTHLFFLIVLSVFFAYLIEPLIQLIRRPFENSRREKLMPRPVAIVLAYLMVFSILGIGITSLSPLVTEQARQLTGNLPAYTRSFQNQFNDFGTRYERIQIPEAVQGQIDEKAAALIGTISEQIANFFISLATYIPWLILVPVLAFFFLKDANLFRLSLLRIFPTGDWRTRVESVLHDVNLTLAAYTRAQLISCVLIGTVCTIGFYLIGLNYALLLGVMAGVLEFIPLIGPLTIGITAVVFGALASPWTALWTAIFLIVLRLTHDYVTYPRIVREGIHLHPLAIIMSVLAGEQVAGIPGVFLSIPVIALLTVAYKHIMEHSRSKGFVANILTPKDLNEEAQ